jgi:dipeptidyl aminopeptidase/acylaminoacyl peptidase
MRQMFGVAAAAILVGLAAPAAAAFTLPQALAYPFSDGLVADKAGQHIAWVRNVAGVRNVWVADAPGFTPRQVTQFTEDDGQELTQLTWAPDGKMLLFVRGGDHDANWPAAGGLQPNPTSSGTEPKVTIWRAGLGNGAKAAHITPGDHPALSAKGEMAYIVDGQVWLAKLQLTSAGRDARRAFFDRGKDGELAWSPDGSRLAVVSRRDDHSFVGVFTPGQPLKWIAPGTTLDGDIAWAPDGTRIAFTRQPGNGGAPQPLLKNTPQPWAIWVADVATGRAGQAWASGPGLHDSYPDVHDGANLAWAAGDRLTFLSMADNWPHLYSVPATGGAAALLTPGDFMVEHVALTPDRTALVYSANAGATPDDDDRRHLFRVAVDGSAAPQPVTSGAGLEWTPAPLAQGTAFIGAGPQAAPVVAVADGNGARHDLPGQATGGFAGAQFVTPRQVSWQAPDGLTIHGQLFEAPGGQTKKPAVIFVHGGPPRQMILGFSYMRYYSNAYAMNQYLASRGFVVLSVNYRLGIGYGWDFQHPDKAGPAGGSEYQDVLAGARWLQQQPSVDPARIGIWGGSYGGYLTGMALARNSDVFKAGVDLHGVHDWSVIVDEEVPAPKGYEQGDRAEAMKVAFAASPVADVATWTSPVLFIHGDDDRNVRFNQTVDLVRRLQAKGGVHYEELVIPDEIHDFLRYQGWLTADTATAEFLERVLKP